MIILRLLSPRLFSLGVILLLIGFCGRALAADVGGFTLQKNLEYDQSGATAVNLDPSEPYQFFFSVNNGDTGTVLTNSVVWSENGGYGPIGLQAGSNGLQFYDNFSSKAALDAAFPNGTYALTFRTSTPNTYDLQATLGPDSYPAIPQLTITGGNGTWSGGFLVIDPTQPVTLNWPAFTGGPAGGTINFQISNSSVPFQDFPADGNHNSFVIPANSLSANTEYNGFIDFYAATSNNNSPPSGGVTGFLTQVNFILHTGTVTSGKSKNGVEKAMVLTQTSNSAPSAVTTNVVDAAPYAFKITSATSGTVTGPGTGVTYPLTFSAFDSSNPFSYSSGSVASLSALNSAYADGNYVMPNGATVSLTGDTYPVVPQVLSVTVNGVVTTPFWNPQGQLMLDPSATNVITWTTFSGGNFTTSGHETFEAYSNNGGSFSDEMRAGLAESSSVPFNNATIAANSMTPGFTYYGRINYELGSTFNSAGPNSFNVAGYITENTFTITAIAPPTGNNNPQSLDFLALNTSQTYGTAPITLMGSSSSGLPLSYSVISGPAVISNGDILTFTGGGSVVLEANQAGNGTYAAAASADQTLTVTQSPTQDFPTWEGANGISGLAANGVTQNDGVPVLLKYLCDINPGSPMSAADRGTLPVLVTTGNGSYQKLTYHLNLLMGGVTQTVQTSSDLKTWTTPANATITQVGTAGNGDLIMQAQVPTNGGSAQFIRLQVSLP